ncbi:MULTISPECIES: DUF6894 family protein [unclassified Bradyrhizobium]|jgi:hypothetical protein|uniref:DUF6894 family protein n=1 Tax=unclassified Bradyrhizobium TaxID=2631580 RepID=UPI001FFA6C39|nr:MULTISPECIES: hypothetical protein [unclassified Bradyrhizobium]MCK1598495.1 hypothetical protein [Bradyrhizobium sp. 164]UPK31382.1 hypothetical protein IVB26_42145 [Bradyrhizobium sp. 195]
MRYYFDIQDDFLAVSDSEGIEYGSLEVVTKEAIIAATSIGRDVFTSKGSQVTLTVRDEHRPLFEMTLRMTRKELG